MKVGSFSLILFIGSFAQGCLTQPLESNTKFSPGSEAAVVLFGKACIELYPKNDGSLESWLERPGVKKLKKSERSAVSTLSSVEYLIYGVVTYSLVYEEINLCTVSFSNVDSKSVSANLAELRYGIVKSGLKEAITRRESVRRVNSTYEYRKNGEFVLRIDYSDLRDGGTILSAASRLRSENL